MQQEGRDGGVPGMDKEGGDDGISGIVYEEREARAPETGVPSEAAQ